MSGRRVVGVIRYLVNARGLQLESDRVLMNGNETIIWKEKKRSRITDLQMDNLRCLLGIRSMDTVPNTRIRMLCGVRKGWTKGFMNMFSGGLTIWRGWRMTRLLRRSV